MPQWIQLSPTYLRRLSGHLLSERLAILSPWVWFDAISYLIFLWGLDDMSDNKDSRSIDAKKYDSKMSTTKDDGEELEWHDPADSSFRLHGFPWFEQDRIYRRMPLKPVVDLPEAVDGLAWHTSGGQVHFRSNTRRISVRVKLRGKFVMDHMPHTGMSGCDLYIGPTGQKRYYHTARPGTDATEYTSRIFQHAEPERRDFTLNMPLYNGVDELSIGLEPGCNVEAPLPYDDDRSVVIYGTSITHGGCASRPGLSYPNIISRNLNVPLVNLGFSGSGRAESEVARVIAGVPDPLIFMIDCEANCGGKGYYEERLPAFIDILRAAHANVEILVVSRIPNVTEGVQLHVREGREARVAFQKGLVEERRAAGDEHIHFLDGSDLLGPDGHEGTVDTTHPNDLGFWHMAQGITPVLDRLINDIIGD